MLIMFCPSMTIMYGSGQGGDIPSSSKIGGLSIVQGTNINGDWAKYTSFTTVNQGAFSMA